ncbi:SAM-dependent methyltransferase [Croceiramulus getboli]|nr:SAM-dependent methyltransferase [Flavobacteriaceae bacterium YJPT1-3]
MHSNPSGKLYLIPNTLGDTDPLQVLPGQITTVIKRIHHYVVEHEKVARRFIKKVVPEKIQNDLVLYPLNKHTPMEELPAYLQACRDGLDMGLISDAGAPGVADPGAAIVQLAHEQHIQVVPLVGPSSILLALMASGMNGQSFSFHGYLPIDQKARRQEIKRLEHLSKEQDQSQLFIETPYRNNKLLDELLNSLHSHTRLCIATDLTLASEYVKTRPVADWKKNKVDLHKRPTLFILHQD